jgi:hypothetical protein
MKTNITDINTLNKINDWFINGYEFTEDTLDTSIFLLENNELTKDHIIDFSIVLEKWLDNDNNIRSNYESSIKNQSVTIITDFINDRSELIKVIF